jgi:LysR family transcriptional activator of mexEF-oprN operon
MDVISGAVSRPKSSTRPAVATCSASACRTTPSSAVSTAAAQPSARSTGYRRGRTPRQLSADAGVAGFRGNLGRVSYTTDLPANAKRKKLRDIPCKVLRGDDRPAR